MRAVVTLVAALACSPPLSAREPARQNPIDSSAVAAFADEFFPQEMARRQIPGAVFVFVSGGDIAIARGFGAARLEPRRPVDPDRTIFRLASVSKTINLADQQKGGVLQEPFITEFRHRFVPAMKSTAERAYDIEPGQFAGEYVYVRRARTTMEKMICL